LRRFLARIEGVAVMDLAVLAGYVCGPYGRFPGVDGVSYFGGMENVH
jgi:hypothetical protein